MRKIINTIGLAGEKYSEFICRVIEEVEGGLKPGLRFCIDCVVGILFAALVIHVGVGSVISTVDLMIFFILGSFYAVRCAVKSCREMEQQYDELGQDLKG